MYLFFEVNMTKFLLVLIACFPFATIRSENQMPVVVLETNLGEIELTLMPDIAPIACENFVGLVQMHYYDGVVFHRILKDFMIQGGDPRGTGAGGESIWKKPFADECMASVKFDKPGLLGMANSGPGTNKSQFFITTVPTPWLHMKHTIFGEVSSGFDTVKKIGAVKTCRAGGPYEKVIILKAYLK